MERETEREIERVRMMDGIWSLEPGLLPGDDHGMGGTVAVGRGRGREQELQLVIRRRVRSLAGPQRSMIISAWETTGRRRRRRASLSGEEREAITLPPLKPAALERAIGQKKHQGSISRGQR